MGNSSTVDHPAKPEAQRFQASSFPNRPERPGNSRRTNRDFGNARCVHYVGFRDDRYWNARRIWGGPAFIHRWWDKRAAREIAPDDIVIFAEGDWRQEPRRFNAPDIDEPSRSAGDRP